MNFDAIFIRHLLQKRVDLVLRHACRCRSVHSVFHVGGLNVDILELAAALETGHEVGTHYNGHFCGPKGGGDWSVKQWHQEMDEWYEFVERWEGKTPIEGGTALPKGLDAAVRAVLASGNIG